MTALFNSDYQHNKHLIDSCFYEFVYQVNDKNRLINQLRIYKNYCCDCLSKVFNKFNSLCKLINDDKNQMIKESNNELLEEIREDLDEEYDYLLDNSLLFEDKLYRYITTVFDTQMSLNELKSYINDSFK